jgi:co-chaperonin GroES (HSP10)
MKAINKYLIIDPITEEMKTESGLLMTSTDTKQIRYKKAKVVSPGSEVNVIKEGDVVYYDGHAGHTMLLNEHPYTIIQERDVVVVE